MQQRPNLSARSLRHVNAIGSPKVEPRPNRDNSSPRTPIPGRAQRISRALHELEVGGQVCDGLVQASVQLLALREVEHLNGVLDDQMDGSVVRGREAFRHLEVVLRPIPQECSREGRIPHHVVTSHDLREEAALVELHVGGVVRPLFQATLQHCRHHVGIDDGRHEGRGLRLEPLGHGAVLPEEVVAVVLTRFVLVPEEDPQLISVAIGEALQALNLRLVLGLETGVAQEDDGDAPALLHEARTTWRRESLIVVVVLLDIDLLAHGRQLRGGQHEPIQGRAVGGRGRLLPTGVDLVREILATIDPGNYVVVAHLHGLEQVCAVLAAAEIRLCIVATRSASALVLIGCQLRLRVEDSGLSPLGHRVAWRRRHLDDSVRLVDHLRNPSLDPAHKSVC
mmetsp:Transcript_80847/g.227698  ORF Transcript_80847/g.227698 Transcript_80847/m.227698 type:complete len:395 (-) Transcript_80847:867-2051(-)